MLYRLRVFSFRFCRRRARSAWFIESIEKLRRKYVPYSPLKPSDTQTHK